MYHGSMQEHPQLANGPGAVYHAPAYYHHHYVQVPEPATSYRTQTWIQRCYVFILVVSLLGAIALGVGCYFLLGNRQEFGPWLALGGVIAMLPCLLLCV